MAKVLITNNNLAHKIEFVVKIHSSHWDIEIDFFCNKLISSSIIMSKTGWPRSSQPMINQSPMVNLAESSSSQRKNRMNSLTTMMKLIVISIMITWIIQTMLKHIFQCIKSMIILRTERSLVISSVRRMISLSKMIISRVILNKIQQLSKL